MNWLIGLFLDWWLKHVIKGVQNGKKKERVK